MADHLTEEEQIEALKRWWNEYWKSVVIPIVLVVAGYYGWTEFQAQKEAKAQAGGLKYDQLVTVMKTDPGQSLSDDKTATAKALAAGMIEEYSGTLYADQATLILARFAVAEGDLAAASAYLQGVSEAGGNTAIKLLAKSRLARVKVAQGEYDAAIALASGNGDSEFSSVFAEVRGDALAAQGSVDAATTAYQDAIDNLPASQFSRRSILQMKVDGADILAGKVMAEESGEPAADVPAEPNMSESEGREAGPEKAAKSNAGAENS